MPVYYIYALKISSMSDARVTDQFHCLFDVSLGCFQNIGQYGLLNDLVVSNRQLWGWEYCDLWTLNIIRWSSPYDWKYSRIQTSDIMSAYK